MSKILRSNLPSVPALHVLSSPLSHSTCTLPSPSNCVRVPRWPSPPSLSPSCQSGPRITRTPAMSAIAAGEAGQSVTVYLHHPASSQSSYVTQHYHWVVTSPHIITGQLHHPTSSLGSYIIVGWLRHPTSSQQSYITQHHHKAVTSPTITTRQLHY